MGSFTLISLIFLIILIKGKAPYPYRGASPFKEEKEKRKQYYK